MTKQTTVDGGAKSRYPNFDIMRLIAASAVIFSHSFLIANGTEEGEPVSALLGGHTPLGVIAVFVFFNISGFLVTESLHRTHDIVGFAKKRIFRIFPGLIVCMAATACLIAPFFSDRAPGDYFASLDWLRYFAGALFDPSGYWQINGVHFYKDSHEIGRVINGSLWTIPHELACYFLLMLIAAVGLLRLPFLSLFGFFCILLNANGIVQVSRWLSDFTLVAPAFFAGAAVSLLPAKIARRSDIALYCVTAAALCMVTHSTNYGLPFLAAYPIVMLATSKDVLLPETSAIGDVSYGIYLYGWPVQQIVCAMLGAHATWWGVFALSLPITFAIGYASWHLIEKQALGLVSNRRGKSGGMRVSIRLGQPMMHDAEPAAPKTAA